MAVCWDELMEEKNPKDNFHIVYVLGLISVKQSNMSM